MRMVDIIQKKRNGEELTEAEIRFLISEYTEGRIPDYQVSAWAMAVYFKGMNAKEIAVLTDAIVKSGDQIDLSPIHGIKVDKHSTGGVGDTTTLVLGPLVATAGVPVAKMSGRGLGHTGGTIDKLESIPGFHVELTREEFINTVNRCKLSVVGQSGNLTPADKKLYALRDVTATVDTIPLIASSVMSKKIAAGADAIVLDVKYGSGAFMKTPEEAERLARTMVSIGEEVGRKTIAIISSMEQPLGFAVGNALEVKEAIDTLQGKGPEDLTELSLVLGAHMVHLGGKASSYEEARSKLEEIIRTGQALDVFKQFITAQGASPEAIDRPDEHLPKASRIEPIRASASGYVEQIAAEQIGVAAMKVGAGRETKESAIDMAVGIVIHKKIGDRVEAGDVIAQIHCNNEENLEEAAAMVQNAYQIRQNKPVQPKLIEKVIVTSKP
ncbi:pyrimidine-nucleoside phosphorylase [Aneurinibacillus tyrosinisolvens]|uniref:pyrimidine-nucleoside phosphorylase n=1 Tax=Aneurinibacillus tyrosinisolvens TaxID=1443435 RepID=UPI00063F8409|nr:pyrimidine-nucleoside phosphorylase [Aneurinibacillus tyrosinisolvens]